MQLIEKDKLLTDFLQRNKIILQTPVQFSHILTRYNRFVIQTPCYRYFVLLSYTNEVLISDG